MQRSLTVNVWLLAMICLALACARDPKLEQLETKVDSAEGRARRLLNSAATPRESLDAALIRLRQAESTRDAYLGSR